MVAYLPQLCNCSPACPPSAWHAPAAVWWQRPGHPHRVAGIWRALSLAGPTCLQPSLHVAPRTPIRLSAPHPHLMRIYSPMRCSAACRRSTLQAVSLCHPHDQHTRHHQPHTLALDMGYLHAPECSALVVLEPRGVRHSFCCTYGRSAVYLREKCRVPTGEETSSNLLFLKELSSIDFQEDFKKTTHTNPCV